MTFRIDKMTALWILSCLMLMASCSGQPRLETLSGNAQGTSWHISVWKEDGVDVMTLQRKIQSELERLDALLSNYRPDSVIEQFNADHGNAPVQVGEEIVHLVEVAHEISEASGGCYDLTIEPLFDLWGFKGKILTPPDAASLQRTLEQVGFNRLGIPSRDSLVKNSAQLRIDVSSVAQGYTVARLAAIVEAAGIQNYLVEIGGELQIRGHKPDGSDWRVGIERPLPGQRTLLKALTISQQGPLSIMTSGTYRHFFDEHRTRYSHVLDARTGKPVEHDTVSVTVIHDDPTEADAWSTGLLCLGVDAGMRVADNAGIAALFINGLEHKQFEHTTAAWHSLEGLVLE